ncbi:MAG: GT-D fold domain-containing glycosyltransferase [Lachnospiraceae bacterium]|nr:GT-D fold domain-containing glycosyltransferase [Lachnospiraceae bacterium]
MDDIKNTMQKQKDENRVLWQELADLNEQFAALKGSVETNFNILFHAADNFGYEVCDARFQENVWHPQIMSIEDTINEIAEHKKSIARFGDCEFGIMCGVQRWRYQKRDEKLAVRLQEVVQSQHENILIGLIDYYGDLSGWEKSAANGARIYLTPETRRQNYALLDRDRLYANTSISRNETWEGVKNQKRIWEGRDCVFIEGFQTRMGVGNDLFDNARSVVRILCPAESAFDRYEEIYREALKQPKDRLMLLALGPTASVLAYDLALQGYQAVDIGHADLSYEVLLRGKSDLSGTVVPNKYNNEAVNGNIVEEIHDAVYESQIIADFH